MEDLCSNLTGSSQPTTFSDHQWRVLAGLDGFLLFLYAVTSLFALFNIWRFLLRAGKWRDYFLSSFYTLVMFICISRMV